MRKLFLMAAFICIAAPNVNAQSEEGETKVQKFFRLTKAADENPTDWNAQLEAGHFLLDKENGMYNMSKAGQYYERIYHLANDYNKEIPDSVIREVGMMLITLASDKKNINEALFYADELLRDKKVGVEMEDTYANSLNTVGILYNLMRGDNARALVAMNDFRDIVTKNNKPGIEYTDVTTALLYENLMTTYNELFGDKLLQVTFDDKNYIVIAMNNWNIEKPFQGWSVKNEDSTTLLYGEDGTIHSDIHGEMVYNFIYTQNGVESKEQTNSRLITITPERRQQIVEAYQKYMKKAKKNKK